MNAEYKRIIRTYEQRHGVGSWLTADPVKRDEYVAIWMDGYAAPRATIDDPVIFTRPTVKPVSTPLTLESLLFDAAHFTKHACLVPPDGGSPTEDEAKVCDEAARRILGLLTPPAKSIDEVWAAINAYSEAFRVLQPGDDQQLDTFRKAEMHLVALISASFYLGIR